MAGAVIIGAILGPFTTIVGSNTGMQTVTNETVTADVGAYATLPGYDVQTDSETVYWFNQTAGKNETLTKGTDYEFDYPGARIKPLEGGKVNESDTLYVSYDWRASSGMTATLAGFAPLFFALLILTILAKEIGVLAP